MEQVLQQFLYGISIGSVYALIALGFSIIFQTTGLLSFAHQEIMMVGGLLGYTMLTRLGIPFLVTLGLAMVICTAIAFAVERLGLARIRKRGGSELNMIVATIGIGIVIYCAAMLIWGPYSHPYPHAKVPQPLKLGGLALDPKYLWVLGISFVAMLILQFLLKQTRLGLAMRAAAEDPPTAELMGIPINDMASLSFAASGALAGLAGILVALLYFASFDMGSIGLKAMSAAVIGGFGSLPGAVVGGLILGVLETYGTLYLASDVNNALPFAILIVVLLLRPSGLLGRKLREV